MAIATYGDEIRFDYSPEILGRHEAFINEVRDKLGIDLKGTSGSESANKNVHVTNSWHGKDAGDYSWDDLNDWGNPNLPKVADIARKHGFQEVISDAHGTGPHIHVGNLGEVTKSMATPTTTASAVQFGGLNIPFNLPQPDYEEKYNPDILNKIVNQKLRNPQEESRDQMFNDITSLRAVLGAGNTESANNMVMPYVQKLMEANQRATSSGAEMGNEQQRQQLSADAVKAFSESRNPMNQAGYAMAAQLGGFKPDPSYIQMSQVSPTGYLQAALGAAQASAQNNLAQQTLANTMAQQEANRALQSRGLDIQQQNAERQWQLMLKKLEGGNPFDPNAAQQANKYLDETVDAIKMLPPEQQKNAMVDYYRRIHPSIALRNPQITNDYVLSRFNEIIPGIRDEFMKGYNK